MAHSLIMGKVESGSECVGGGGCCGVDQRKNG